MAELVGIRAYARHRGVSQPAVQDAIRRGRLAGALVYPNGPDSSPKIDPALADQLWAARTDPAKQREKPTPKGPPIPQGALFPGVAPAPAAPASTGPDYHQLRAASEALKVRKGQLEVQAMEGELVDATAAQGEFFRRARSARDALLAIPGRVRDTLAASTDARACGELLTREITKALEALADDGGAGTA